MYTWKINMKNGDCHIVKSDIQNSTKFITYLLGTNASGLNVSQFKLEKERLIEDDGVKYRSNWIAIISSDVSSVEWLSQ